MTPEQLFSLLLLIADLRSMIAMQEKAIAERDARIADLEAPSRPDA